MATADLNFVWVEDGLLTDYLLYCNGEFTGYDISHWEKSFALIRKGSLFGGYDDIRALMRFAMCQYAIENKDRFGCSGPKRTTCRIEFSVPQANAAQS